MAWLHGSTMTDAAVSLADDSGFRLHRGYLNASAARDLVAAVLERVDKAPFYRPCMPRTGTPLRNRMTNLGPLGWISDKAGYRYEPCHPETGAPWPSMPAALMTIWRDVAGYPHRPEACLVNYYEGADARLGLHVDADEDAAEAPVVSVSLGDTALFRLGGPTRRHPTRPIKLFSGDVVVLGGASRRFFHGVGRIYPGTSGLVPGGGRINLTLRRVRRP
ncbi:MAG: alpha-ketoglutarate-dependent dioxygenase AlkB [Arenicellales bacterium]